MTTPGRPRCPACAAPRAAHGERSPAGHVHPWLHPHPAASGHQVRRGAVRCLAGFRDGRCATSSTAGGRLCERAPQPSMGGGHEWPGANGRRLGACTLGCTRTPAASGHQVRRGAVRRLAGFRDGRCATSSTTGGWLCERAPQSPMGGGHEWPAADSRRLGTCTLGCTRTRPRPDVKYGAAPFVVLPGFRDGRCATSSTTGGVAARPPRPPVGGCASGLSNHQWEVGGRWR
jgi:hypothetical protein